MAAILSRVFARKVRSVPTPLWVFVKAAYRYGAPLAVLSCMQHYAKEHRRGAFAIAAPNDDVARVTGRPAESFEVVVRRLATLPANQRSPSHTLREFARFLAVPFVRVPNTPRYLRGLQIVAPMAPQYAGESEVWRREHGITKTAIAANIVGHHDEIVVA